MIPLFMLAACQPKAGKVPALNLSNLDETCAPGEDFYKYATHGWQVNNPLKPEFSRFGTFDQLNEDNVVRLNDLFSSMTTMKTTPGSVEQKIVDIYKQGLDSVRLNKEGAEPLRPYVEMIQAVSTREDLVKMIATLHDSGADAFFGCAVEADLRNSEIQILYLGQGGLGIGDRDYYLLDKNADIKEGYRTMLAKVLGLAGVKDARNAADNTVFVEDILARNSWTREQERDILAQYNPYSTAELEKAFPGFPFAEYLAARGIPEQEKIVVAEPSFFKAFAAYFATADLEVLKDYLLAHMVNSATGFLSDDFYAASFDFYSRQMAGVKEKLEAEGADVVSGWRKAKLRGDEHTSYAASRTFTKILIYEGIVLIGICMDTMIHFAWAQFMDSAYYAPLASVSFGLILCVVEAWSVKEKADKKQRKRMEDAATALAAVLDKETILTLLKNRLRETEGEGHCEVLDKDDN